MSEAIDDLLKTVVELGASDLDLAVVSPSSLWEGYNYKSAL